MEAWEGLTLHALRNTAITVMVNDLRLPLGDVAAIVGHDDIRTTENYREPDEVMVRQRLASLTDLMFPQASRNLPSQSGTFAVLASETKA